MKEREDTLATLRLSLELLKRIPKGRTITAPELRQQLIDADPKFEREPRTIQRLLETLSAFYDIERDDSSKPYRYCWKENAKGLSLPGLSTQESLLLTLAAQQLGALLPTKLMKSMDGFFAQARSQLNEKSSDQREREWLNKVRVVSTTQPLLPPKVMPDVFQQVSNALYDNQWLDVVYQNANGKKAGTYRVMPLGLVQQGPRMYLACRFEGYNDNRSLALHRLKSATTSTLPFVHPKDFDLQQLNDDMGFGDGPPKMIRLRFRIDKANGLHILECPLSADQTHQELPDGYVITATVADTDVLGRWLNGFGDGVSEIKRTTIKTQIFLKPRKATMSMSINLPHDWVCDGRELKPKNGATSSNTWVFDGKEIKPKTGAVMANTWLWDGKELKPKTGALMANTWVADGSRIKPKTGALSSNTYEMDGLSILVIAGKLVLHLY